MSQLLKALRQLEAARPHWQSPPSEVLAPAESSARVTLRPHATLPAATLPAATLPAATPPAATSTDEHVTTARGVSTAAEIYESATVTLDQLQGALAHDVIPRRAPLWNSSFNVPHSRSEPAAAQRPVSVDPAIAELGEAILHQLRRQTHKALVLLDLQFGTSTPATIASLACSLARSFPERLLLIDGDTERRNLSYHLGQVGATGLTDVLSLGQSWDDSLCSTNQPGLLFLGAGRTTALPEQISGQRAASVLNELKRGFGLVLIHGGQYRTPIAQNLCSACDGLYLVADSAVAESDPALRASQYLQERSLPLLGCIAVDA